MVKERALRNEASKMQSVGGKKPDVFIVGAPKCGTSAMDQYLAAHPEIYMAKKEMHAFGSDLRFGPQFYRRDQEAYLAEFATRNGERRAGEASVWYLFSTQAAAEIHAFNPEARIIIMLREPAEMLYSLYYQFRFDGNEHLPTFEEALAAEALANGECYVVAQPEVALHLRAAQVHVAVFEARLFVLNGIVRWRKWRQPGIVQNQKFGRFNLDFAGRHLGIDGVS